MDGQSTNSLQSGTQGSTGASVDSSGAGAGTTVLQAHGVTTNHGGFIQAAGNVKIQNSYHSYPGLAVDILYALRLIPNLRKIHLDILSKAAPGTGVWLLKTKRFRIWLDPDGNLKILWGTGIPGAGKTVMASIVINDLEERAAAAGGSICVAYVYFRYSDAADLTMRTILEILVKQTVERHPDCACLAEQAYSRHLREKTQPTEAELLQLLHRFTQIKKATFYILEALDEAPEKLQVDVVRTLASLNAKLFITSRPLKSVEARISEATSFSIVAQDHDLDLHIAREISRSRDLQDLLEETDTSFRESLIVSIKRNCCGMFLHASLQLDAICRCTSTQDVIETLDEFPSEIEGVYRKTWERICSHSPKNLLLTKTVLLWVLNAARSMKIDELRRAIATSPITNKFERKRMVPAATLVTLCCGLITVEEETQLVRLVHYTAKDALQELLCEAFPHPHNLLAHHHNRLAAVCMTHLTASGFQDTTINSSVELIAALQSDPLLAYASDAWAIHARLSIDIPESSSQTAAFVSKCRAFPSFTSPNRAAYFDILGPLHILALFGLPFSLISQDDIGDPNLVTKFEEMSPLMLASWCGNKVMVQELLLLPDIEVNCTDKDGFSALMLAASKGHEAVVSLFLATREDVHVNMVDNEGWSVLMYAASEGHETTVALLLTHAKIEVNLADKNGRSAVVLATHHGHVGILKLLHAHPDICAEPMAEGILDAILEETAVMGCQPTLSAALQDPQGLLQLYRQKLFGSCGPNTIASYRSEKYHLSIVPNSTTKALSFHLGEPIAVKWEAPSNHSRKDWIGLYEVGANKDTLVTTTSSLGLWLPVHDKEWDGDTPLELEYEPSNKSEPEKGIVTFKGNTLPWLVGRYEIRYHHDGKYNVMGLDGPFEIFVDKPAGATTFTLVLETLKRVVPSLIPALCKVNPTSFEEERESLNPQQDSDCHSDNFILSTEQQAERISAAINQIFDLDFTPEVIVTVTNLNALSNQVLARMKLLGRDRSPDR